MSQTTQAFLLGPLLKRVSRSFYLTLRVLPAGMRDPVGLAYLLARAADTIADTSLVPPAQRLTLLLSLREQVNGGVRDEAFTRRVAQEVAAQQSQSDEKVLLESLAPALRLLDVLDRSDRLAVQGIVTTLTQGMEFDLRTFPDERSGQIGALRTLDELDRYTYLVAGCVGEFWTTMTYAHLPGTLRDDEATMRHRGVRLGKALQMTNVLRDCGKDLRIGRCYLPSALLEPLDLVPRDLLQPGAARRARPLLRELLRVALGHFRAGADYLLAIPGSSIRLRLACLWPIVIGLETLKLLAGNDAWLDPAHASRVPRAQVYRILVRSMLLVPSNRMLRGWIDRLIAQVEARLND